MARTLTVTQPVAFSSTLKLAKKLQLYPNPNLNINLYPNLHGYPKPLPNINLYPTLKFCRNIVAYCESIREHQDSQAPKIYAFLGHTKLIQIQLIKCGFYKKVHIATSYHLLALTFLFF